MFIKWRTAKVDNICPSKYHLYQSQITLFHRIRQAPCQIHTEALNLPLFNTKQKIQLNYPGKKIKFRNLIRKALNSSIRPLLKENKWKISNNRIKQIAINWSNKIRLKPTKAKRKFCLFSIRMIVFLSSEKQIQPSAKVQKQNKCSFTQELVNSTFFAS